MNKRLMLIGLCGLVVVTDAFCAKRPQQCELIGDKGYFDLVISHTGHPTGDNNGNHQPALDSQYSRQDEIEAIIQYWADGLYEATEGAHFLRNITIYTGGEKESTCDVQWIEQATGVPNANKTILTGDGHIRFYEEYVDWQGFKRTFMGNRANWELGGYALAHESGHYLYNLKDEYCNAFGDVLIEKHRVKSSIMTDQFLAAGRNYKYLNFSIKWQGGGTWFRSFKDWENTQKTEQHYEYERSGWETLVYENKDRRKTDTTRILNNLRDRPFYEELQLVAPKGMNPPVINLDASMPLASLPSRAHLNIIWNPRPVTTVVIDKSGSMAGGGLDNAKAAACDLIDRVEMGTAVSVLAFDANVTLVHNFLVVTNTANRTALKNAVNGINLGSGTAIGDAARVALNNLVSYGLSNRTATVYLLTDGENNRGEDPYGVIPDYVAKNVSLYGLGYGVEADAALGQMARETGGTFVNGLAGVMDVKEAFIEANALLTDRVIVAKGAVGAGVTAVDIPIVIDSSLTNDFRLTVNVSGGLGASSVVLERPGGAPVYTAAEKLESDGSTTRDFWVDAPVPGVWRLTGTKQSGATLRYICDAKMRGGSYYLSLSEAEWDEETGELIILSWLGREASTDGAVVSVQLVLTNGVVLTASCTNFSAGAYAAVFEGVDKWLFEGARVTVTASNPNGEAFETWREATCGASETPDAPIGEDFRRIASMTVVFPRVKLTVVDGTGSGHYRPGEVVSITQRPPSGAFSFTRWAGDTQTVANVNVPTTTVTVTNDMSLRVVYQANPPNPNSSHLVVDLHTGTVSFGTWHVPPAGSVAYYEFRERYLVLRRFVPAWHSYTLLWYSGSSGRSIETLFTRPVYLGVFPVTQGQWNSVMGAYPPSNYTGTGRAYHPAERVSYVNIRGNATSFPWPQSTAVDGNSFMGKLRTLTGLNVDLPTEGQWNWVQNVGSLVPGGEEMSGWVASNSGGQTRVVGTRPSCSAGMYDMIGNVKEWCLDRSNAPGNNGALVTDPVGSTSGTSRVQRGGSYLTTRANLGNYPFYLLARWTVSPTTIASDVGFRVALTYQDVSATINGVTQTFPAGVPIPIAAPNNPPGQRFTGWGVSTTATSLGSQFVTNAPNTLVTIPLGASLTLTPLYEPIPLPPPPYHDVTYEVAPVLVKDFKLGFVDGQIVLSWGGLAGETVLGYAVEAKASLTDPEWDTLFEDDGVTISQDGTGGFSAGIPEALENADGKRYQFFQIRAVVER